ncbi:MAG: PhoPQ-activated pathogenicity-related family protein [Gemmataceae bacterium]|nr:PhoPQ-activated pathogenicity-related family protein [Gemmataceae bacterium]
MPYSACSRRWLLGSLVWLAGIASEARADLFSYVNKPDASFSWKLKDKLETPDGTIYHLQLVSQTWQDIRWEHDLQVFLPKGVKPGGKMLLWNQGGKASLKSSIFGMQLAQKAQAPVALLFGIPNQPLFGKLTEDALIAETFVRYLDTKDPSWPLLFPMVKSLVKAMDALQEFAQKEWGVRLDGFIVSGASKRGWTTWLTAAADTRVKAIAPLVIDTLNMPEQLKLQLRSYGRYSDQIRDYTKRGLAPPPDTPEARRLWQWVDPWNYRDRINVPTMIINGANDPYWTVDSLNLYWDGLKNDKWLLYVPNAGHNLRQKHADGKGEDLDRAINTLIAFSKHIVKENPMPKLHWKHDDADGQARLTVTAEPRPLGARLWVAQAPTRDFRKASWKEQPAEARDGTVVGLVAPPQTGYVAFFGELDFEIDGVRHPLSTQVRVLEAQK